MQRNKLFNITDANAEMTKAGIPNDPDKADRWARIANAEYQKMKKVGNIESFSRRRAITKANNEVRRIYGGTEQP